MQLVYKKATESEQKARKLFYFDLVVHCFKKQYRQPTKFSENI